jgi:hypothetical protein
VLSYGSEAWTIRTGERRLISAEMSFMRTAGYTRWDHKRNEEISTELQISQITELIYQYRKKWKEYVDRMSSDRIPKMILQYQQKREETFRKTFEKMEGFSFVTSVTGLNGSNTGKDDDDDDDDIHYCGSTLNVANEDKCSVSGKAKSLFFFGNLCFTNSKRYLPLVKKKFP